MIADSSIDTADALEELSRTLRTVSTLLDKRIGAHLDGIPVAQWHVLAALDGGEPLPMATLQSATQLTGPSLTRLIDAMIDANLVLRKVGDVDRRHVLVAPTRRGSQLYATQCRALASLREGLGEDADAVLPALLELLDQLRADDRID